MLKYRVQAANCTNKQKGTGGSRKGNIRNPLYKGGGTIFGPKPHSYDIKLNNKVKELARLSALTYKAKENAIVIIEDVTMNAPKTKSFVEILNNLKVADKKALFVMPDYNDNVYLSLQNIPTVLGLLSRELNTYDIVNSNVLVITESALKQFSETKAEA